MVEGGGGPACRGMAVGTVCHSKKRACGGVRRIIRVLPICEVAPGMAAVGEGNLQMIVVADMTGFARNRSVAES